MSVALLDELLSEYVAPLRVAYAAPTPANPANAANREGPCGPAPHVEACEGLRNSAKAEHRAPDLGSNSQTFAAVRDPQTAPQSEAACVLSQNSQNSQDSQGCPATCGTADACDLSAVTWTDGDIARFLDRRGRLLRWGWAEPEAEKLADRLVRRDREADERVSCADCVHHRPGRCGNHKAAGLGSADVGRDLAAMLQRCAGFQPAR